MKGGLVLRIKTVHPQLVNGIRQTMAAPGRAKSEVFEVGNKETKNGRRDTMSAGRGKAQLAERTGHLAEKRS